MKINKIVHIYTIDTQERFGGQNILWKKLANFFHDDQILHFVYDPKLKEIVGIEKYFDFEYPVIQKNTNRAERFYSIFNLVVFLIFKGKKNQIYHFHDITWRGLIGNIFARLLGFKTIYESVLQGSDTPKALYNTRFGFVKLFILRKFNLILCISSALQDDYLNYNFSPNKVCILNNPVDKSIFFPKSRMEMDTEFKEKYQIPQGSKVILFVGSVKTRKGFHILVDAFIKAYYDYNDIFLLVVGPHNKDENPSIDDKYVNDCKSKLQEYTPNNFNFVGLITSELELSFIYRNANIFIFPSYEEGLGNVVLEAMASKLKIISSNLPVLDGILIDRENCLLFPIGDIEKCIRCLKLILSDTKNKYDLYAQNAMETVKRSFSISNWNSNLNSIYKSI